MYGSSLPFFCFVFANGETNEVYIYFVFVA